MLLTKLSKENPRAETGEQRRLRTSYIKYINRDELDHLIPPCPVTDTEIIGIAESIRSFGLLNPIRVYYNADTGRYSIISGERRFSAMVLLGRTRMLCHVITDSETCDATVLAEYCLTSHTDSFRASTALEYLINSRDYSINELARMSGISSNRISRLLNLSRLTFEERRRLLLSHMSEQVCIEISEIEDTETRKAVIDYLVTHRPNVKKLAETTKRAKRKTFGFNFRLIDNSLARLTRMIQNNGIEAKTVRENSDTGITYTISVSK